MLQWECSSPRTKPRFATPGHGPGAEKRRHGRTHSKGSPAYSAKFHAVMDTLGKPPSNAWFGTVAVRSRVSPGSNEK